MPWPAKPFGVFLHHPGKRGDAGCQAEMLETFPNRLPGRFHHRGRIRLRSHGNLIHGVAFLVGSTPRAYRLKASNAALSISTEVGTFPLLMSRFQRSYFFAADASTNVGNKETLASL